MNMLRKIFQTKSVWLEGGFVRRLFWQQFFTSQELRSMTKNEQMLPELIDIGDWVIMKNQVKVKTRRVWNPHAFCWDSGKNLFGKRATIVKCEIGSSKKRQVFYFAANRYTTWLLRKTPQK